MKKIEVIWDGGRYTIRSEVYAIDTTRDRFLIVDDYDFFKWVPTDECQICNDSYTEKTHKLERSDYY